MTEPTAADVAEAERLAAMANEDTTQDDIGETKKSIATRLVEQALDLYHLHVDDGGAPFAIRKDGPNLALPFRAGSLGMRSHLARTFYASEGRAAPSAALADALTTLEGEAAMTDPAATHLRTAPHDDGVVLDLGTPDGSVVVIDARGWRVTSASPVTFRRTAVTGALPIPVAGGDLEELRDLLNVSDGSWPLLVGWLVAAVLPELHHPILSLRGPMGSAKSTTATRLVNLVDPSPAPLRTAPRDAESWVITAASSWVVALDNVSTIAPWMQDALCRAVTGDGLVRRQLYTDSAVTVVTLKRAVILTSIDVGAMRGDLADRLVRVELDRIEGSERRTDAELTEAFTDAQPRIFGALLDLVAKVLNHLPEVKLDTLPRMADFAKVLASVDHATAGLDSLARYLQLGEELMGDVVDDDPVAAAVQALAQARGEWVGTAQDLHDQITPDRPPKGWPTQARSLVVRLMNAQTALRSVDIEVTKERTNSARLLRVKMTRDPSSPSSPSSPSGADQPGAGDGGRDDDDPGDDGHRHRDDAPAAYRHGVSPSQEAQRADRDGSDDAIRPTSHEVKQTNTCTSCGQPCRAWLTIHPTCEPDGETNR